MGDVVQKEISFPIIPESFDEKTRDYFLRMQEIIREISLGATYLSALTLQEFSADGAGFLDEDDMASDSATSVSSQQAIAAAIATSNSAMHDAEGGFSNYDVNGTKTKIYTKYFTGTLDADATTTVAHGITGIDNILHVSVIVANSNSSNYTTGANFRDAAADTFTYEVFFDGTNITIASVGADAQGEKYRIKIDYVL